MAKASMLGKVADFYVEEGVTIPITKYTSTFSDTLNIYVGGVWIKRVEGLKNGDTVYFQQTEIERIYSAMSKVSKATFTFHNTTYNKADIVGTHEVYAFGSISEEIKPSISHIRVSEAVLGLASQFQGYVQSKSRLNVTIEATAGTGSSIASYQTAIGNHKYSGNEFTTNELQDSGEVTVAVTVTDSRGRSDTLSLDIDVFAYDIPQVSVFNAVRCNSGGVADIYGSYVKLNVNASISPVNDKNNKLFKIEYKKKTDTVWSTLATYSAGYEYVLTDKVYSGFSTDYAYDLRLTCTDFFVNGVKVALIPSGFAMIDLNDSGKGMAIGGVSTKDALEIFLPIYDRFDTTIGNGLARYGDIDPDTTLEELVLTDINVPENFCYVRTMFYGSKSTTASRTQIAFPYAYSSGTIHTRVYVRSYVNGWSDWEYINDDVSSAQHSGSFIKGSLGIETGKVVITPVANTPTGVTLVYKNKYKNAPVVFPRASTNHGGTVVLDTSPHMVSATQATIYLTRTNAVATNVFYVVIGEVE